MFAAVLTAVTAEAAAIKEVLRRKKELISQGKWHKMTRVQRSVDLLKHGLPAMVGL